MYFLPCKYRAMPFGERKEVASKLARLTSIPLAVSLSLSLSLCLSLSLSLSLWFYLLQFEWS